MQSAAAIIITEPGWAFTLRQARALLDEFPGCRIVALLDAACSSAVIHIRDGAQLLATLLPHAQPDIPPLAALKLCASACYANRLQGLDLEQGATISMTCGTSTCAARIELLTPTRRTR